MNTSAVPRSDADVLERLLRARYSCRGYLAEPVPDSTIERILEIAQRTASWSNAQPWQVHITRGQGTERFRDAMSAPPREDEASSDYAWPSEYRGVYRERRRECGFALYASVGIAKGDSEGSKQQARENYRLFGAPHVAIITSDAGLGTYGAIDCGAYVANFMLAAASVGVASIAQAALSARPQRVREVLGIAEDRLVVCGISFGYADTAHRANGFRTTRAAPPVSWHD